MLTLDALTAALPLAPDPAPHLAIAGDVATLTYADADAYTARSAADASALASLDALAVVASWMPSAPTPVVCLRYALAPIDVAPRHTVASHRRPR